MVDNSFENNWGGGGIEVVFFFSQLPSKFVGLKMFCSLFLCFNCPSHVFIATGRTVTTGKVLDGPVGHFTTFWS